MIAWLEGKKENKQTDLIAVTEVSAVLREKVTARHDFFYLQCEIKYNGCLVQVGNGIELGFRFEPHRWRPCGVTWDSSRTVVGIKLRRTSAL